MIAARPSAERGFSLAEMLVSLAITGLLAVLLLAGIGQWAAIAHRADAANPADAATWAAQALLRTRLAAARPDPDVQTAGAAVDFAGTATSLDLIAPAPDAAAPDAPWRYRLVRAADGTVILYAIGALASQADAHDADTTGWQATRLLAGTADLAIRYYGPDPFLHTPGWQTEWQHRPGLPRLIRITVRFPAGDRRGWPDLFIRPRALAPAACGGGDAIGDAGPGPCPTSDADG